MSQTPPRKPEHIQVKVMNSLLDVRGHFDRERMERAARALDNDLRGRIDRHSGNLPDQGFLSLVLLTALEKTYEIERLKDQVRARTEEISDWRQWASGISEGGVLQKDSGKE